MEIRPPMQSWLSEEQLNRKPAPIWNGLGLPVLFVTLLWVIHFGAILLGKDFRYLGIIPHEIIGLRGVFFAPLLHSDFLHLVNNSIMMLILGFITFYFFPKIALRSFFWMYLLTGIAVWLVGEARSTHIGASGVVYALASFIFWTGIFRRSVLAIVWSVIITMVFSSMLLGILPNQPGISWESHLFGLVVGAFAALYYRHDLEDDEIAAKQRAKIAPNPPRIKQYFLARDTFEMTRQERAYQLWLWQQQQLQQQQQNEA